MSSMGRWLCLLRSRHSTLRSLTQAHRYSAVTSACYHTLTPPKLLGQKRSHWKPGNDFCRAKNSLSTDGTLVSRSAKASKPRAVIFDLGGVVVPSPQGIFDRFEEEHGLQSGSLVATIKATGNGGAFAKMERGEYSVEQFCEPFRSEYLTHTARELSGEQCWEFIQQLSDFTKLTPHPCVVDMFQKLKVQGVKVAILTNNFRREDGRSVFPEKKLENVDIVSLSIQTCTFEFRPTLRVLIDSPKYKTLCREAVLYLD